MSEETKLNKFTGWQRIGCLIVIMYIAPLAIYIIVDYRTHEFMVHSPGNESLFVDYLEVTKSEQTESMNRMINRMNVRISSCDGKRENKTSVGDVVRLSLADTICESAASFGLIKFKHLNLTNVLIFGLLMPSIFTIFGVVIFYLFNWVLSGFVIRKTKGN